MPNGMFLGGGQVGVNYQFWDRVVIGAEVDFDWLSNSSTTSSTALFVNPPGVLTGSTATVTVNNRWLTTVTGRLGYAWDRLLLYAKGGGAWVGSNSPTFTVDGAPVSSCVVLITINQMVSVMTEPFGQNRFLRSVSCS